MDERMKITVGICAYNTRDYILQCVHSAMDQDYEDLEIIVIDDGSDDGTGALLDGIDDPRVRVFHKQNEGLSAGREDVLRLMTGGAVYWMDSDDFLLPGAVSNSARLMREHGADIVKTALFTKDAALCGVYDRREYMKILLPDTIQSNVIGCLFKKRLYEDVHHIIGYTTGDYYIFPRLVDNMDRIVMENSGTYHYRAVRPGSITYNGRNSFKGFYPRAVHHRDRYDRYKDEFPEECRAVLKQLVDYACMACLFANGDPRAGECRQILVHEQKDIMASSAVSPYKKWLSRQVISSGKLLFAARSLHSVKGHLRTFRERLKSRAGSGE